MFSITCECGHTDDADSFITISPIRKVKHIENGEEVFMHVADKTFKCPKCGATEINVVSYGFSYGSSFVEPDAEEF